MEAMFRCCKTQCGRLFESNRTVFTQSRRRCCPSCNTCGGHIRVRQFDGILRRNRLDAVRDNIQYIDLKTGYEMANTVMPRFFKTMSSSPPEEVLEYGFDPNQRAEACFTNVGIGKGSWHCFRLVGRDVFKFIFAFPAQGGQDATINKALVQLGWLPEPGGVTYMYVYRVPMIFPYASFKGEVNASSEVMFPQSIDPRWISSTWKIEVRRNGKPLVTAYRLK